MDKSNSIDITLFTLAATNLIFMFIYGSVETKICVVGLTIMVFLLANFIVIYRNWLEENNINKECD